MRISYLKTALERGTRFSLSDLPTIHPLIATRPIHEAARKIEGVGEVVVVPTTSQEHVAEAQ